jgi:hypothetical protein
VSAHFSSETTIFFSIYRHLESATYLQMTRDYAISMFLRISFFVPIKKAAGEVGRLKKKVVS